jgi:hypothetical protein
MRAKNKPNSNSSQIGTANNICDITSGGVSIIPKINARTIIYGLFLDKDSTVDISNKTTIKVIMGTSKARPNAKNIFITKLRKLLISVAISTPTGAMLVKKLNIKGKTAK